MRRLDRLVLTTLKGLVAEVSPREKSHTAPYAVPVDGEPWVCLASGDDLAGWSEADQVKYNQQRRALAKHNFYIQAFDYIYTNEVAGDYLEFGCHRARTFRMALTEARRQNNDQMKFFAFDSFEGLPEIQNPDQVAITDYHKGALTTSVENFLELIRQHGIYVENVETVKGFYENSLTSQLQDSLLKRNVQSAMICIDCDLYESAVPVLRFVEPLMQPGTLVYIDDYHVGYRGSPYLGVGKAFQEFQASCSRFRFAPFLTVGGFGQSFVACE